jgi:uncharacterized phage-associated protein
MERAVSPISDAFTVADELLKIAKRRGRSLSPMQLLKLVYIAHGWSLAILGRDLFSDRIEAWKYGPVIPDLYRATKRFGSGSIPLELIKEGESNHLPADIQAFLQDVFDKYGALSGIQLSNLTHRAGSPWSQVYETGIYNGEISDDLIREHYMSKLNEQRRPTAREPAASAMGN